MQCQKCDKNVAAFELTINSTVVRMCHSCLQKMIPAGAGISTSDVFHQLLGGSFLQGSPLKSDPCPKCGATWRDFIEKKRLGCAYDYSHFEKSLAPILLRYHGSAQHVGHFPIKSVSKEEWSRQMKLAIQSEDYEKAAEIRDILKNLGD